MLLGVDVDGEVASAFQPLSGTFIEVIQDSLGIANHSDLLAWLQGGFQTLLPHEILLVAWGDPTLDEFNIDVTSRHDDVRTRSFAQADIQPTIRALLSRWADAGYVPCQLPMPAAPGGTVGSGQEPAASRLSGMRHVVVHGIRNQRDDQVCLYVLMASRPFPSLWRRNVKVLLPYIDAALRQVDHLPTQRGAQDVPPVPDLAELALSERETDIVHWVAAGKTNHEIGMIMGISPFTVKNHLRRIFQKLDVSNRAQAVDKILRHAQGIPQGLRRQG